MSLLKPPASVAAMPYRSMIRWCAVVIFFVSIYFYHPSFTSSSIPGIQGSIFAGYGVDDLSWVQELLRNHSIGPEITFASRTIRYVPDATERLQLTEVRQPLFPNGFANVTITNQSALPAARPLDLHLKSSPRPSQINASNIIFGASTTYARFTKNTTNPVKEWKRWLTDGNGNSNGAGLVLALYKATKEQIALASRTLSAAGINATVIAANSTLDMPGRYVDLVQMLWHHPTRHQRKYFALIDDDTFFPYMDNLLRTLSHYNHKRPYYIGTFTERADWMLSNEVPMAYGGAGIFLTAPTVEALANAPCTKKRKDGQYASYGDQGDRLLYNCLSNYTDITLTYLPSLNQEDQFGDAAGFYESGKQPLSIHHYKSWHEFRPDLMHSVADVCGEDCVLQRFEFTDNFIMTNGYSVVEYPNGIDFDPLQVEGTFTTGEDEAGFAIKEVVFSYAFGVLRKSLNRTGKKKGWGLLGAIREGNGRVKQVYVKLKDDARWVKQEREKPERDSVVVLTWVS